MLVAPIMWYGTTRKRRPVVHALDFATAPASSGVERAPESPRNSSVSTAMKWLLPLPKLPCRYAPLLVLAPTALPISDSASSKQRASCGVTT